VEVYSRRVSPSVRAHHRAAGCVGRAEVAAAAKASTPLGGEPGGALGRREDLQRVDPVDDALRVHPREGAQHVEPRDAKVRHRKAARVERRVGLRQNVEAVEQIFDVLAGLEAHSGSPTEAGLSWPADRVPLGSPIELVADAVGRAGELWGRCEPTNLLCGFHRKIPG